MEPIYNVQEKIDKRYKLHMDARAVLDVAYAEKRDLNPEETAKYDSIIKEADSVNATIERMERTMAEERALNESRGRKTDTAVVGAHLEPEERQKLISDSMKAWALRGVSGSEHLFAESCKKLGMDVRALASFPSIEARALGVTTTSAGGYTVPNAAMGSLYEIQKAFGTVRALSNVIKTTSGAAMPVPTVDDTANAGSITSEAGTIASNVDPTFGTVSVGSYKTVSPIIKVSIELLRDSAFDLPTFLNRMLGTRLARKQNTDFTVGNGTTAPQGCVTGAAVGKTAAATNAITMDEIIDLEHSVDIAYRGPGACFQAHDLVIAYLRKLKNTTTNEYYWQPSSQAGVPAQLHGIPMFPNNDMDSAFTTGKKLLLYGNLQLAYFIRDIGESMYLRSDVIYWVTQEVGFLACQFSDAKVLDSTAIKYLRTA